MSSNSGNQCPYCDRVLVDKPKRKTKSPSCKKFIFVRGRQLVTEEQAQIADWLKRLQQWGLNEQEFQKHKEALAKQFGHQPKANDVVWRFLNSRVNNPIDYFTNKIMYQ